MKLTKFKVKSFRTITSEQEIFIDQELTLVGPNNSGKTNTLLAIKAFFTGYDNEYQYDPIKDLPYTEKNTKTSLTCTFKGDPNGADKEKFDKLKKLREMLGITDTVESEFSINVYFNGNKPVYQIHPGTKRPKDKQAQFSALQKIFINSVLDHFQWYYIPSNKSIEELYEEFVTPFVRKKVVDVLKQYDEEIKSSISSLTDSMNQALATSGIKDIQTSMEYPGQTMEGFISGLDLYVKDKNSSSVFLKGMGIQAAILLSSFKWIAEQQTDKKVLWLIEEPETFMHPSLAEKCSKILDALSNISTVIKTTHAINFIPPDVKKIQGVSVGKTGNTLIQPYTNHIEATESIRASLGVKFSDYFGLSTHNVFLEGETDKMYIEKVIEHIKDNPKFNIPLLNSQQVQLRDFTGTTDLKGFLRANNELMKKEVKIVSLFDSDKAGIDAIKELSGYFGKKGGYHPNKDYVLIPNNMEIESLFPNEWIKEAYKKENVWFENWVLDANENIISFKIRDKSKKAYMQYIFEKIENSTDDKWIEKFFIVLNAIENALAE